MMKLTLVTGIFKRLGCLLIEYWASVALKDELPTTNVGLTKYL